MSYYEEFVWYNYDFSKDFIYVKEKLQQEIIAWTIKPDISNIVEQKSLTSMWQIIDKEDDKTKPSTYNNNTNSTPLEIIDDFYKNESEQKYKLHLHKIEHSIISTIKTLENRKKIIDNCNIIEKIDDFNLLHETTLNSVLKNVLSEIGNNERLNLYNQIVMNNKINDSQSTTNHKIIGIKKDVSNDELNSLFSPKNVINYIINNKADMDMQFSLIKQIDMVHIDYEREIKKIKANNLKNKDNANKPKLT